MPKIDLHNKTFLLVENSKKGTVNSETQFHYSQKGQLVTAEYYGGPIVYGKIIALLKNDTLDMLYQCLTTDNELKTGKAMGKITFTENNKMKMKLNWQWLDKTKEKGTSVYIEQ
jgi:hypothetical protein